MNIEWKYKIKVENTDVFSKIEKKTTYFFSK